MDIHEITRYIVAQRLDTLISMMENPNPDHGYADLRDKMYPEIQDLTLCVTVEAVARVSQAIGEAIRNILTKEQVVLIRNILTALRADPDVFRDTQNAMIRALIAAHCSIEMTLPSTCWSQPPWNPPYP